MQTVVAEALCLSLRVGRVNLVSLPSDHVPRRIDWGKWVDGISVGSRIIGPRLNPSLRITMSCDHQDPKDNLAITSLQGQGGLEDLDPIAHFADLADSSRFLFVGTWAQLVPSWLASLQAVFTAQYSPVIAEILGDQNQLWSASAAKFENMAPFLVSDDVGRFSSMTSISQTWRSRQLRSAVPNEIKSTSWMGAVVDIHSVKSAEGVAVRLSRVALIDPESWCGSPKFAGALHDVMISASQCPEIWISAPGAGVSLWLADQIGPLTSIRKKLRMPSTALGWHSIRDFIAFLSDASPGSVMLWVGGGARLHVFVKEKEVST